MHPEKNYYKYNCKLVKVIDGDTIDVIVDLGFHISNLQRLRLRGIDTPEINAADQEVKEKALQAKNRVIELFKDVDVFQITSFKSDKFGRYLADVYLPNQSSSLNNILLQEGLAVKYE